MSKTNIKILLVEDELTLSMIIKDTLDSEGFEVVQAENGNKGLQLFFESKPDILVADVMMPEMDGFEMVSRIRKTDKSTPILFLTARSAIRDVVSGFEIGASDYLKKPFNMQELIIRVKSLVNRAYIEQEVKNKESFEIGNYAFDSITQKLIYGGNEQELSHRESEILKRLCLNRNDVVNTQDILMELWGDDSFFNTKSLHVFITKLRHRLSLDNRIRIVNVRGIGYKLVVE